MKKSAHERERNCNCIRLHFISLIKQFVFKLIKRKLLFWINLLELVALSHYAYALFWICGKICHLSLFVWPFVDLLRNTKCPKCAHKQLKDSNRCVHFFFVINKITNYWETEQSTRAHDLSSLRVSFQPFPSPTTGRARLMIADYELKFEFYSFLSFLRRFVSLSHKNAEYYVMKIFFAYLFHLPSQLIFRPIN